MQKNVTTITNEENEKTLKIGAGAELYRRYDMWGYNDEVVKVDYLLDVEDRLDKLSEYYSNKDLVLNDIGEISDYITYGLEINNTIIDNTHLEIGVMSHEYDSICELGDVLGEKIYEVTKYVEEISYEVTDNKLIIEII